MDFVSMRRAVAGCVVVALLVGCGGSQLQPAGSMPQGKVGNFVAPQASQVANVTFHNNLQAQWLEAYVDYAYKYDPFFHNEAKTCMAPRSDWKTSVTYNYPDRGPQIRFRTYAYTKKDCADFFPDGQRELAIKEFPFKNNEANFDVEMAGRSPFNLCSKQQGTHYIMCAGR
jgi:hypothetical protein